MLVQSTNKTAVGLYFKVVLVLDQQLGDARVHHLCRESGRECSAVVDLCVVRLCAREAPLGDGLAPEKLACFRCRTLQLCDSV